MFETLLLGNVITNQNLKGTKEIAGGGGVLRRYRIKQMMKC